MHVVWSNYLSCRREEKEGLTWGAKENGGDPNRGQSNAGNQFAGILATLGGTSMPLAIAEKDAATANGGMHCTTMLPQNLFIDP
jgi:hypothetical protein